MRKLTLFAGLAVFLVLLAGGWWCFNKKEAGQKPEAISRLATSSTNRPKTATQANSATRQIFFAAANDLAAAKTAEQREAALARLRQILATGTTNEISTAIQQLLDSKLDAPTGGSFKIGQGGFLKEAPTLRTFLLDKLAAIDPAAAAVYARDILNGSNSPDEWAVALRNLAAGDGSADARALLSAKIAELLRNLPWQQNPSEGYLEAFDVAVYLGDAGLAGPLAGLVRNQDNPATAHAAYLALDRMVIANPVAMLAAFENDPSLMQGRENTRADYFARADVQDTQQRQILESYLLNPQISQSELAQFAGIFPNANYMISPNLLTSNPTPNHAVLVARDAASLQLVGQWLADPRFVNLRPQLQIMQQRLQQFVQQEQAASQ